MKKKSKFIYTVTVVYRNGNSSQRTRTWGWYSDKKTAEKHILSNATDMFEAGYYNHAIIEEVDEGILPLCRYAGIYKAYYKPSVYNPIVKKIRMPSWCKNIVNWSMG